MTLASRLARIRDEVAAAAARAGRDPAGITLLGATKRVGVERIREAIDAGLPAVGENYVQEAVPKIDAIGRIVPWHFIGRLQRNKARIAARLFDAVETVDSAELAVALDRASSAIGRPLTVLLEVNLAGDPHRPGVAPESALAVAARVAELPGLRLRGLMGMAPIGSDPGAARPHFRTLKRLWDALHNENRQILSMGTTADYAVAIEEGSTLIRLGTAIFGPRP